MCWFMPECSSARCWHLVLARAGFSARGTFLGASIALGLSTLWALWLVPDAFLRFILLGLAHTIYRVRIIGRSNVPAAGGRPAGAESRVVCRRPVRDRQHRPAGAVRGVRRVFQQAIHRLGAAVDEGDPDLAQRRPEDDPAGVSRGRPGARQRGAGLPVSRGPAHANGRDGTISARARADRQGPHHADHSGSSRPPERQHLQPDEPPAAPATDSVPGDDFVRRAVAGRRTVACDSPGHPRPGSGGLGLSQGGSSPVAPRVHPSGEAASVSAGVRRFSEAVGLLLEGTGRRRSRSRDACGLAGRVNRPWGSCCRRAWGRAREPGGDPRRQDRGQPQFHRRPRPAWNPRPPRRGSARWSPAGPFSRKRSSSRRTASR